MKPVLLLGCTQLLVLLLGALPPAARAAVAVDPTVEAQLVGAAMRVIPESAGPLRAEDVLAGAHDANALDIHRAPPNLGYPRHRFWAVVELHNAGAAPLQRLLVLWRGAVHQQQAWIKTVADDGREITLGESAGSDITSRHAVIRVSLPVHSTTRIVVRIDSATALSLDYRLLSNDELARIDRIDYWFFGLLAGVIFAVAIYMLALFIATRERIYLSFGGAMFGNVLYHVHTEGYAYALWPPQLLWWGNLTGTYAAAVSWLLFVQFVRDYMQLNSAQPRLDRWLIKPMMALPLSVFPLFLLAPWLGNSMAAFGTILITVALSMAVLRGAWLRRPVWSFIVGILLYFAFTIVFLLKRAGVLPDAQMLSLVLQLGSAAAAISFAVAVMHRVRRIVDENREAQRVYATRLEIEVKERTAELETAHDELMATHRDLVETQQQLVLQEKMAGLGTLTAGIAHEINNPTNFTSGALQNLEVAHQQILGFLRELAGEDAGTEVLAAFDQRFARLAEMTATAREGCRRIQAIVRDLRTFTRLDEAEFKSVPISEPLNATVNLIRTRFPNIAFEQQVETDPSVEGYPAKLSQLFLNLIVNACEAVERCGDGRSGRVVLAVCEADREAAAGRCACIEVRDNGCGMDAATQAKMFEPFFTTKPVGAGTGLGLAMAFGIVREHGGRIEVQSQPGQGTRIAVELPISGGARAA